MARQPKPATIARGDIAPALAAFIGNDAVEKAIAFTDIVNMLWGPKTPKPFIWHPWAERMRDLACEHNYLAVLGCANSGKTDFFAVWALVNWLADPVGTMVLVTSTSLKDSRKRIWGSIVDYYQAAGDLPGKLIDSMGIIRTDDGRGIFNDKQGISLVAADKRKEKDAIGKMIGMKNKRVLLVADELPELSPAIMEAAFSNLANNPFFQLIGIGNFASIYDPLGEFARPVGGYERIGPEDEEWKSAKGHVVRFDGLKSPALTDDRFEPLRWLFGPRQLTRMRNAYGENSAAFWRMCRSFPSPETEEHAIYSESDFIRGEAHGEVMWLEEPTPVCAADPSFTNGGDDFAVVDGLYGQDRFGVPVLSITGWKYLRENIGLSRGGQPRDLQLAEQLSDHAQARHVPKDCLGIDASGPGGLAFGSVLQIFWNGQFTGVKFGESPSQRAVSEDDPRLACEAFTNKSSELWFAGRNFIRAGQIKGLPREIAAELKVRHYKTLKSGQFLKSQIEPKKDMKVRLGKSPDLSDAFLILVELCRERFGFTPGRMVNDELSTLPSESRWLNRARSVHSVYHPDLAFSEAYA